METQPLPLLYFTVTSVRAGVEEHILTLLKGLDRKYFRLHLACPQELADVLSRDLPSDVAVFPVSPFVDGWVRGGIRLAKYLVRHRIVIVHSHIFRSSLFASPIASMCRVPVILETSHGREAWRTGGWKSSFLPDRLVSRFVDSIIAVSEANARFLVETKKLQARKVMVIRNGSDLDHFDPNHQEPVGLRQSLGFGDGDPILLALGRLEPQKGHKVLIDAMPRVVAQFPRVRLVCVGEGSLRESLDAQTRLNQLEAHIRFPGFHANVADWLALADLSVLPSFYEGLPLVAIESLAAGRPMVASAVDGTPEVVVDGQTGLTFPPGDSASLAEAICKLLADPGLRQRMAASGRAWVLKHFSQEQQVRKTQEFYLAAWERWAAHHSIRYQKLAGFTQTGT